MLSERCGAVGRLRNLSLCEKESKLLGNSRWDLQEHRRERKGSWAKTHCASLHIRKTDDSQHTEFTKQKNEKPNLFCDQTLGNTAHDSLLYGFLLYLFLCTYKWGRMNSNKHTGYANHNPDYGYTLSFIYGRHSGTSSPQSRTHSNHKEGGRMNVNACSHIKALLTPQLVSEKLNYQNTITACGI